MHEAQPHPGGLHPLPGLAGGAGGGSTQRSLDPDEGPQTGAPAALWSLHPLPVPANWAGTLGRSPSGHPHPVGAGGPALQDQGGARARARAQTGQLSERLCDSIGSSAAVLRNL